MAKRHRQVVGMNMSKELKKELLGKLLGRYARRNREGKSRLLDELCEDYKYDRKYAIKLLGGGLPLRDGRAHPGPERRYEVIVPVVQHIWLRGPNSPAASAWCRSCGSGCPSMNYATVGCPSDSVSWSDRSARPPWIACWRQPGRNIGGAVPEPNPGAFCARKFPFGRALGI